MKRTLLVQVAVCSALVVGCSKSNEPLKFQTKADAQPRFPTAAQQAQMTPEFMASHMETPQETAKYLHDLAKDPKFNPKEHSEMLQKYSGDANAEVASAAKQLADKPQ